ncbi:MAG TPA: BON domain-containing protein [Ideonella sp.]|nr:BON domain-containing protein [Ideonella sp.]
MKTPSQLLSSLIVVALAGLTLTACGKRDDSMTAGEKLDQTVAQAEQKTDEAKTDIKQEMGEAKDAAKEAAQDAKVAGANAMDKVGNAVEDAAITASVNAELAKDPKLSALKINVDTAQGRVALKGTAPDSTSRDRATQLAAGVKGVMSVDNQLTVDSRG